MKCRAIAAVAVLLMSMQAFAAIATCLLPCCKLVAAPTQCSQHEQAPAAMNHEHHHHAVMQFVPANTAKLSGSAVSHCSRASVDAVVSSRRARVTSSSNQSIADTAGSG